MPIAPLRIAAIAAAVTSLTAVAGAQQPARPREQPPAARVQRLIVRREQDAAIGFDREHAITSFEM